MSGTKPLPLVSPEYLNGIRVPTTREAQQRTWQRLSPFLRTDNQALGQRTAIGCVSLEITQRCNLDCTLCYLSEMSEDTLDIPMEEIKRRIDEILLTYGPRADVQISGGDPTLRKEDELIEIVRYCRSIGLQPALLTNGIKATRPLLQKLAAVGLTDVAFHVDMTQRLRKPDKSYYQSEEELNAIREEYIERARGLGIAVVFNTTVCRENFHEIPMLARFFRDHADVVGMCSFQLHADTGRGVLRGRPDEIEPRNIIRIVNEALGAQINFDAFDVGHQDCNRIGYSFVCNKRVYNMWWDPSIINYMAKQFDGLVLDRGNPKRAVRQAVWHLLKRPRALARGLRFIGKHLRDMKSDLVASRFKVHKLSFVIHNFMGADCIVPERIDNCSFMVMTTDGPLSMCLHNAHRDDYITKSFTVDRNGEKLTFDPVRPVARGKWEQLRRQRATASAHSGVSS